MIALCVWLAVAVGMSLLFGRVARFGRTGKP
jgi:hypothetical protein